MSKAKGKKIRKPQGSKRERKKSQFVFRRRAGRKKGNTW